MLCWKSSSFWLDAHPRGAFGPRVGGARLQPEMPGKNRRLRFASGASKIASSAIRIAEGLRANASGTLPAIHTIGYEGAAIEI